jgi:ABC-2 type transport system permease protein
MLRWKMCTSRLFKMIKIERLPLVWKQMKIQLRMRSLTAFSVILYLAQPAIFSTVGYFLARTAGHPAPDFIYTVIGSGIMGVWSTVLFTSFYDILADRREGVLELIVGSPTSLFTVLTIRTFTNVLTGTISLVLSIAATILIFDFLPPAQNIPAILVSLGILLLSFWCLGIFIVHLQAVSRITGFLVNYLEFPVTIFAGFMFPPEILPGWARWVTSILPMSWAVRSLNLSFQSGTTLSALWMDWSAALGLSSLFLIITIFMSRRVHNMMRVNGELGSI